MTDCKTLLWTIKGYDLKDNLVLLYKIKTNDHNLGWWPFPNSILRVKKKITK